MDMFLPYLWSVFYIRSGYGHSISTLYVDQRPQNCTDPGVLDSDAVFGEDIIGLIACIFLNLCVPHFAPYANMSIKP